MRLTSKALIIGSTLTCLPLGPSALAESEPELALTAIRQSAPVGNPLEGREHGSLVLTEESLRLVQSQAPEGLEPEDATRVPDGDNYEGTTISVRVNPEGIWLVAGKSMPSYDPNLLQAIATYLPEASWREGQQVLVVPAAALAKTGDQQPIEVVGVNTGHADRLLFVSAPITRAQLETAATPDGARFVAVPEGMAIPSDWGATTEVGRVAIGATRWLVLEFGGDLRSALSAGAEQRGRAGENEDLAARSRWFERRHKP